MSDIVLLSDKKYEGTISLPIFDINFLPLEVDLNSYDALIFTSKNAIYSLENSNIKWKDKAAYVIAPKTADVIKNLNGNLEFISQSSHGNDFALELIPLLKNKKVLYIRGKRSVSNLTKILLDNNVLIDELISYETTCSKKLLSQPKKNSIIIFTSPSTIECFFKNLIWDDSYTAIAIGKTTAQFLPKNINYNISSIQSIEACIELAKKITKN